MQKYICTLDRQITQKANQLALEQANFEHTSLWDICERYIPRLRFETDEPPMYDNNYTFNVKTTVIINLIPRNEVYEKDN